MKPLFNGEQLKKARIYRGLTVAELAEQTNCQRQTLSMYELSRSQPNNEDIVNSIARVLNFPKQFFYEYPNYVTQSTTYFRSLLTTSNKYRTEQVIKMSFLSQVYSLLQDYVEFPKFHQPNIPENFSPEQAANTLRESWNLGKGPIDNIISIVEQHGILVTTFSTSTDDVDAFSQFVNTTNTPTYLIAYSNNKTSAARIHFDIAHELGHICLHEWSEDITSLPKDIFKQKEREANDFAAAFLLPEETFKADAMSGPQTLLYYKQLKRKWKVSIAAMIRRSEHLGIITKEQYQNLIRTMQRRGQRKEEPLDDVLTTNAPALLKASVLMLLQEGIFTPKEFMFELSSEYKLSIDPSDIEYLLDLPNGTLTPSKIIDFKTLQLKKNK